ncbi:T9SS type A sorting domain-containing protein [Taibaiella lutea]|uniref:T9SS type A sorting domain-containing protein n=1 Tax=Taibaiella lutea TaxID=2608001 RepID=A0A5M6CGB5_9BACT|nr:T9SS type A sorting domain-containing protein [Taibaiella lutea]KAA5533480.1 T9SS type A sorting domain-containing protein [Taibaiella lutea]
MSKTNIIRTILSAAALVALNISLSYAQPGGPAVGQWRSYLPYSEVNSIATDGTIFYCSTNSGFFTYDRNDGSLTSYAKENGMHDIGLSCVGYDPLTTKTILAYTNSNIDLFKDGSFTNIPAIKLSQGSGDKTVYNITAAEGEAYLSTGIGLIILNLNKEEIKETVVFYDSTLAASVYATVIDNNDLYAATSVGLFKTNKENPFIQNYLTWTKLNDNIYSYLTGSNHQIYAAASDSLFEMNSSNAMIFKYEAAYPITHLDASEDGIWIAASKTDTHDEGYGIHRKEDGTLVDSFFSVYPTQIIALGNGDIWYGDAGRYVFTNSHGLRKRISATESEAYIPVGPITSGAYDVTAYNGDFWVAHGAKSVGWVPLKNRANFSHFTNEHWDHFGFVSNDAWFQDFIRVLKDNATGKFYAASYTGGLYELDPDNTITTYRGQEYFSPQQTTPNLTILVSGMALDESGNLWMTNYGGAQELVVKTADGNWYKMNSIVGNSGHTAADVIVDDYGQKWFIAPNSGGVVVYNDNGTIDNTSDDNYRIFKAGAGAGNLPDNNTLSIAKDKDGAIWVGTANGIGIISCTGTDVLDPTICQGDLKVLKADSFAGYLFQGQYVKALAVDGANRKWVGTTNGIWLVSDDAEKTIFRFTQDNSPLPSNNIERINIDPVKGDVYISTDKGLIAYRSIATEGGATNADELYIYPNPVPSNYTGMIAIRGFAENSDVRITDISGQLIYRTKANGGQAVWDGMDYTGRKAQSGVYLVFGVNKDGTQKITGKFILHR